MGELREVVNRAEAAIATRRHGLVTDRQTESIAAFHDTFTPRMVSALLAVVEHAQHARDLGHVHEGTQLAAALDRLCQMADLPDDRKTA